MRSSVAAVTPFAVWLLLLQFLPATAFCYFIRTLATGCILVFSAFLLKWKWPNFGDVFWGLVAGAFVSVFWIWPENFEWYRTWVLWPFGQFNPIETASPYDPSNCGMWLTVAKLVGSAFVIAPVEELFFRSFLYRRLQKVDWQNVPHKAFEPSSFAWMVLLFSLEHPPRFAVAALCGIVYGFVFVKRGLPAAIVAHVTTNLALAIYVIKTGAWHFW